MANVTANSQPSARANRAGASTLVNIGCFMAFAPAVIGMTLFWWARGDFASKRVEPEYRRKTSE